MLMVLEDFDVVKEGKQHGVFRRLLDAAVCHGVLADDVLGLRGDGSGPSDTWVFFKVRVHL